MNDVLKMEEQAVLLLRSLYRRYGYQSYKMSRFEEYDLYVRNKDFLVSDQVITFSDHRGKLLALKPDVTLSIIKNAAKDNSVQRVCYNENVYRVDPQTRTFREIMQTGLECIGALSDTDIAEVVLLAAMSLQQLGKAFVLDISHMGFVGGILRRSGLSHEGRGKAMACLHQKNSHELVKLCREESCDPQPLLSLVEAAGAPEQVLEAVDSLAQDEQQQASLQQLRKICTVLADFGFGDRVRVDFSVGTDMKYYSGVVFKGYLEGITAGILSGGQYDLLLKKMGRKGNAVGFAIYLNLLEQIRRQPEYDVDAVLLVPEDADPAAALAAAAKLRQSCNVVTARCLPENLRWRKLYELREGEAYEIHG